MKKFVVIYYAPAEAMEKMANATVEEMKEGIKPWTEWAERCGDGLVDLGSPLGDGKKVTQDGVSASEKGVAGYSVLQAEDMDGALKMLESHPHLGWDPGCAIEVYEMQPIPEM